MILQQAIKVHQADEQSHILVTLWLDCVRQKDTRILAGDKNGKLRQTHQIALIHHRSHSRLCVLYQIRGVSTHRINEHAHWEAGKNERKEVD